MSIRPGEKKIEIFNWETTNLVMVNHRLLTMTVNNSEDEDEKEASKESQAKFGDNKELNAEVKAIIERTGVLKASRKNEILQIKHTIELKDQAQPVYCRPYRRSVQQNEIITEEIQKLGANVLSLAKKAFKQEKFFLALLYLLTHVNIRQCS